MADVVLPLGVVGALLVVGSTVALLVGITRRGPRRWRALLALGAGGSLMIIAAIALIAITLGPGCNTFTC